MSLHTKEMVVEMDIKEQIKTDRMCARKQRDESTTGVLTYIMGQIELQEKSPNAPKDIPLAVIKSHIKGLKETVEAVGKDSEYAKTASFEIDLLQKYLPEQVDMSKVRDFVKSLCLNGSPGKGEIMKAIKAEYGAAVDMREASQVVADFI